MDKKTLDYDGQVIIHRLSSILETVSREGEYRITFIVEFLGTV